MTPIRLPFCKVGRSILREWETIPCMNTSADY
jgi:hypothetical protein